MNLSSKLFQKDIEQVPTRNGYGEGLVELGQSNPNVVVLSADLAESTRAKAFGEKYPERFFELGVAEQNMMGVATGLALSGKIPFVSSYATFSPGRNWDQLRVSVCYSEANVKVAGSHAGLSVGPDGATHQALEDIAIARVLPNLTVIVPCDAIEAKKVTLAAAKHQGPVYFRLGRAETPVFTTIDTPFEIGKAVILKDGTDVSIIGCGQLVYEGLLAAEELSKKGINARVINCHTIKPIDKETIIAAARETGAVVTIEEHQIHGGLGGAVAEVLGANMPVPMEIMGVSDHFGESGEPRQLLEKYHLLAPDIVRAAEQVIKRKK
ncbi:MAG: transketolase [Candidatus Doudnabacteria bacterium RIFCSPHIGHO2_02_FULL_46_11]|uniref:Transketolase n=1 Tax=Candidatus Doudnabacteria bacterium RIFCSPHIGHO2_02_FULL_46_11 TaxID=1817832 RepID=A0A1F5P5E2_9BACT|nr:MAG: transketolase [Candidatus Doudnabacteria bacterium RIFCSPHIGHO2_02_FULL_46_11]